MNDTQRVGVVATLTFPLPECSDEFETASKGVEFKAVIYEVLGKLRNDIKYNDTLSEETLGVLEKYREFIAEELIERKIDVY